jgi:phage virion morphogenesis protein
MAGARIEIIADTVTPALRRAGEQLDPKGLQLLLRDLGEALLNSTRERAQQQVDPAGRRWAALSPGYKKWKDKKRPGLPILKFDNHLLGDQLSYQVSGNTVLVGTNAPYGAAHQFGGTFAHKLKPGKVRLRTDAKGNLLRQGKDGRLAVFAKKSHKRAVERSYDGKDYSVTMPARAFLGISLDDEISVMSILTEHLSGAFA